MVKKKAPFLQYTSGIQKNTNYQDAKNRGFTAAQLEQLSVKWLELEKGITDFVEPLWNERLEELRKEFLSRSNHSPQSKALLQGQNLKAPRKRQEPLLR